MISLIRSSSLEIPVSFIKWLIAISLKSMFFTSLSEVSVSFPKKPLIFLAFIESLNTISFEAFTSSYILWVFGGL